MSKLTNIGFQQLVLLENEYQNAVFFYNRMPFTSSMNGQSIFNRPLRSRKLIALRNKADQDDLTGLKLYSDQTIYTKSQLDAYVAQIKEYIKNPTKTMPIIPAGARAQIVMYDPSHLEAIKKHQDKYTTTHQQRLKQLMAHLNTPDEPDEHTKEALISKTRKPHLQFRHPRRAALSSRNLHTTMCLDVDDRSMAISAFGKGCMK